MTRISIVTPLYRGKKHIDNLLGMIEENAINVKDIADIEWVVSNDDPSETIDSISSDLINVKVLNTDRNRGIQGARVVGLENCSGDYVLFLDQDDRIFPNWALSQLKVIGDADAVVCNAIYDGRPMYGEGGLKPPMTESITKKYNISQHIGFTVGQTMIRKSSIPKEWTNNWMKTNCCDDHFLWICMYAYDCVFQINEDVLYEHIKTGDNLSEDSYNWAKSTHEMMDIVVRENILSGDELKEFIKSRELHIEQVISNLHDRYVEAELLKNVVSFSIGNKHISNMISQGSTIAIYGYRLGKLLSDVLNHNGIRIQCFIDQNAENIASDIPVYKKEDTPSEINVIICTLIKNEYKAMIKDYYSEISTGVKVISLEDLFY